MNLNFARALVPFALFLTLFPSASIPPSGSIVLSDAPALATTKASSNMVFPTAGKANKGQSYVELAKAAMFRDGDYLKAKQYLDIALQLEPNEPLAYAMSTLYPFSNGEYEKVKEYGSKTVNTAAKLMKTNPLRGNLYQGVGTGILAAYEFKKTNGGALGALSRLQKVFAYLDKAKKIDANNPELNLIEGYINLLLAVNLPFSDTSEAIDDLKNASPKYLAWRGMYLGYRDLKDYDKANTAINNAIKLAPQNAELTYYKAQLLGIRGREKRDEKALKESIKLFEVAYRKRDRLLISTLAQILSERCQAKSALQKTSTQGCYGFEAQLKQNNPNTVVGLTKLPAIN